MAYLQKGAEPPKKGKGSQLTPKMRAFVAELMVDNNASQAVLRAGYKTGNPDKHAAELMAHPLVKAAVDEAFAKKEDRLEVKGEWVLNRLIRIADKTEDMDKFNEAIRAIELIGKTMGMFKERQEVSGPDGEAIKYEQKVAENADDFTKKLQGLAKRSGTSNVLPFTKDA